KHEAWREDKKRSPALNEDEWQEVISILVQAQKSAWAEEWIEEEQGLLLGPWDFWISLREPKEGKWPPEPVEDDTPRIDPELLKFEELPDETAGAEAIQFWNDRQ